MNTRRKPSKHFLAVIRTNLDELPIGLFANKRSAMAACRNCTEEQADKLARLMLVDYAGRINTAIITFIDGKPSKLEPMDDWDESRKVD